MPAQTAGTLPGAVLKRYPDTSCVGGFPAWHDPGRLPPPARAGLYTGVYMLVALILVMARRVLPSFIEKGLAECHQPGPVPGELPADAVAAAH